jgi:hypothetical protein
MVMYIVSGIVGLLMLVFVWGFLHLRQSQRTAYDAIGRVTVDQVPALRDECERVFREEFEQTLSLGNLEPSAQILSDRLDDVESLKQAFAKPNFYWYFVLPLGAFLGELMRTHARGEWHASEEGGVELRVPMGSSSEDHATTYPFEKVMKQVTMGDKGDIYAYLLSATQLNESMAQVEMEG